jgi:hypothetical protein
MRLQQVTKQQKQLKKMPSEHIIFRIGLFKKESGKIVCQECKKENKWNSSAKYTRNSVRHLKEIHTGTIYKQRYDELLEASLSTYFYLFFDFSILLYLYLAQNKRRNFRIFLT